MRLLFFLLSALLIHSLSTSAATDPSTDWRVLSTPHFELIYDAKQSKLARDYARYAEVAYADLVPIFKEAPEKTTVWINNTTDISNGFATAFPYPMIVVFPTIPNSQQGIGEYADWGQELMTHEYTHILQFEPKHGVMAPLSWIFGSIITPNGLLPRWWLEGMAVEAETQLSLGGRLRSHQQGAILRNLVRSGQLDKEDISRVNEVSIPDWLGGRRPYLLGSLLWKEIVDQKGNQAVYDLNQRYSRRVPFFINSPVEDLMGTDYSGLLDTVYQKTRKTYESQITKIKSVPTSPLQAATKEDESISYSPLVSPDGKNLAFLRRDIDKGVFLVLKTRSENQSFNEIKERKVKAVSPVTRISWSPDSKSIYFDKVDQYRRYYSFSDIYRYDIEKKKVHRVTKGLRVREPTVSLDGQKIAFIKVEGEQMELIQADSNGKNLKRLYKPKPGFRISSPEYYRSKYLVWVERNKKTKQVLRTMNLKTGKIRTSLSRFSPVDRPRKTSKGLLFSSSKSGVPNIYLATKNLKNAVPLTNVETSATSADWDTQNNTLFITNLSEQGLQVASIDQPRKLASLPKIDADYSRNSYKKPNLEFQIEEKDYYSWKYLLPRYWLPYIGYSSDGGTLFQASTGSYDPLGKQAYSLLGAYDTSTEQFNWVASYRNQMTALPLSLSASDLYDLFGSSTTLRREQRFAAHLSGYIWGLSSSWSWTLGWDYLNTEINSSSTVQQGPEAGLRYADLSKRGKQHVPSSGGDAFLTSTYYIEDLGDVGFFQTQLNTSYYFSDWFPKRHTLSSKFRAVYAPENDSLFIGASTASGNYDGTLISNQLLMRGYLSGNFIAQNAFNLSFEYIFPLSYPYTGWGTFPLFSKSWHARLVFDAITLDGVFFDEDSNVFRTTDLGDFFYGGGGEIHWSITAGYHMPLRIFLGVYYGTDTNASGGLQTLIGIGL